ncbi:unnamed protein product, partial [Brenthis ino]
MQSLRRSTSGLLAVNKQFKRSVTINAAVATNDEALKSWREIPGPSSLPLIGQIHHFLPGGSLYHHRKFIADVLFEQYGPIVKLDGQFGSPTLILLRDAEGSAQILRGENWMPIRAGFESLNYFRTKHFKKEDDLPDTPTGLISDQGEVWKKFRSTVNPILLQPKTIKLYSSTLNEVAEDMVKRMRSKRNEKNMIEGKIDVEMNLWALESIGVVALGGRINCFDPNLPEDSPARKLIQIVHNIFKSADELDFKPSLWRYMPTPAFKRSMKYYADQIEVSQFFIRKAMENLKNKKTSPNEEKSVLEKLLEIDERVAVVMASDMLFAGVDTAANTIIATFYLLAKNPEKQNKLREEIMSNQEKRPYLKACLKESLRMMPVVSGNMRTTTKEYNIMGYKIPKGMYVTFAHQSLSLMEEHYPKPKEFIPERWLANKEDPLYHGNAHPFAHSPFGFGVRSCIGRRIAELELETFLAKAIENFQIEWFGPPLEIKQTSLNYIVGPFNFIFKDV